MEKKLFLKKLIGLQLVKKIFAVYVNLGFITMLTKYTNSPYPKLHTFVLSHHFSLK